MVRVMCADCQKEIDAVLLGSGKIRCPYCGGKVLQKKQDRILESIKAR